MKPSLVAAKKYCGIETFFLKPLIPQFRISEYNYRKRYKIIFAPTP